MKYATDNVIHTSDVIYMNLSVHKQYWGQTSLKLTDLVITLKSNFYFITST